MENVRRRIPFKLADDDDNEQTTGVLDEQQQEYFIEDIRKENESMNQKYHLAVRVVLGLSAILQLVTFSRNPLLSLYPILAAEPSIPLPIIFVILSLLIHLNLALLFFSEEVRVQFEMTSPPSPLSYQLLYLLSAVAPTLSLFLQKPWQTTVWWCATPLVVFVVQSVMEAIQASNQGIAELEALKYTAPGA